jgi:lactate permease
MGYSTYVSIALPAIGYDSLCTYALLGAPIVVFVDMTNQYLSLNPINNIHSLSLSDAGSIFFMFLPVVSTFIGFSMLWIIGKWKAVRQGVLPCLITGITIGIVSYFTNKSNHLVALTGIMCGISVIFVMILYLMFTGKKVIDKSLLTMDEIDYEKKYPLWKAALPWILLIILILALNLPDFMFQILYRKLTFPISGVSANRKEIISTRFLWNAYTWIFVSTIVSIPFLKPTKTQLKDTVKVWFKRSLRPVFSSAVFFSVGEVMNMSGFNILRQKYVTDSMVKILADSSASFFRGTYGCIVSFIGLLGGFITGSEASTIAMFGKYSMATASNLNIGLRGLIIVTAGIAFGGGLASVISPAKLQNAAASIDKLGEENQIIRMAFVFSIILTVITSLVVVLLLAL